MSAIALSSSAIGWTSVSVWHMTSTGRFVLADEVADDLDAVAAEVDDRPAAGQPAVPEPGASADPGCVSRDRTQVTSPIAPAWTEATALSVLGV